MALKLWLGGSGSGKSHELYQYVIRESQKYPETNYIVIVPEQFTLQTQRDLVMMHPRRGIMNIDVLSFNRLAYRVFDEVGGDAGSRQMMDDMGKSLVLRRIAAEHASELKILGRNLKKLGYINEIKSIISEFMQYNIKEAELDTLLVYVSNRPMLQYKLQDIKLLYQIFMDYMKERYTTKEELLATLSSVIDQSEIVKKSVIVFDGFTGFTPIQNQLLSKLMTLAKDIHVTVLLRNAEGLTAAAVEQYKNQEQELFYLSYKTIASLSRLAEETQTKQEPYEILPGNPVYRFRQEPSLAYLEQHLFEYHAEPPASTVLTKIEAPTGIHLTETENPQEEMRSVCTQIHALIREHGYRYGDIAIITGDIEQYAHVAEQELQKYELPCFIDRTRGILLNPFVEYLRALTDIFVRDYSYESMFRYLKTSLVSWKNESGETIHLQQEDVDALENYVLACGIRRKSQWNRKWVRGYQGLATDELMHIEELRTRIMDHLLPLDERIRAAATAEDYTTAFYELIDQAGIEQQLHDMAQHFEEQGEADAAKEYRQIYRLVMDLFDQVCALLPEEKMNIREYGELLDAGFNEIRVGITPPSMDEITVGDITRTRLREIKALFFVGVNDGIVPKGNSTAGIISDMDREHLAEQEIELAPSSRQQAYMQRIYLYMLMSKPTEHLYLSYVKVGTDGKSMHPSYLIQTIQTLFPKLETERFERTLDINRLYSKQAAFEDVVAGLRDYHDMEMNSQQEQHALADGKEQKQPQATESTKATKATETGYHVLLNWYLHDTIYSDRLKQYISTAFSTEKTDRIGKAVATALYGKVLENSVTRLELYAACAYSHFLQYGLHLRERELYSFEANDMGTIFHDALQRYAELLRKNDYTWFDISAEQSEALVEQAVADCMGKAQNEILYSTARYGYVLNRIRRILNRTVTVLGAQIRKGKFVPNQFEFSFSAETDYQSLNISLSDDEAMHLSGRIDRMDTCEEENRLYVKVIDYKSGSKSFDLAAVYDGLQLQLVVYLDAAMEMLQRENPDQEVIPAGILYYHIDDPLIEKKGVMTPEEIHQKIMAELCTKGLVNSDEHIIRMMDADFERSSDVIPVSRTAGGEFTKTASVASSEQFGLISDYVNQKIASMGREILTGEIAASPYSDGKSSACAYCQYHAVCGFDERIPGAETRQALQMDREQILEAMCTRKHEQ